MKKQFRYALGEILIVIVGISIAFSMNKCAEIQKNKTQKKQYLENIKKDIEIDKQVLEGNLNLIGNKIKTLNEVIPKLNSYIPPTSKLFRTFHIIEFHPKDITYQTMINSGDFKLINDFSIKSAIETHYSNYKLILKDYERQEIIHRDFLGDYMINNIDYEAMRKGKPAFKEKKLFKNILQSMSGSLIIKQNATSRGIKSCDSLIGILDKHIR